MTNEDLNKWIMYHEIHKLHRLGFSKSRIARYLVIDPRKVHRYLNMDEQEYEQYLIHSPVRTKILDPYEDFVFIKLSDFPDTSSAQIHDWLKEHHDDLPDVSPRTVYNYVMFIRHKHNIPYVVPTRNFTPVEELPYGSQAQVDFGQYNMRMAGSKRKKVFFFAMVLSRSRMKFVLFSDMPFTAEAVVTAHEMAFNFFCGIPRVIVYDLDRTMVVDENLGDIILTAAFKQYTKARNFELHFCRKSDPQSKGKVENVIQYIKKNFLYNRVYSNIETLNQQVIRWLDRTANHLPHNFTKEPPKEEFIIEKQYLNPYIPLAINNTPKMKQYTVRKTDVIAYKSNFYSLPLGTYRGPDSKVLVKKQEEKIFIYDIHENLIATHNISQQKGKTIINTNHRRDTSKSIKEMISKAVDCFTDTQQAADYINQIKQKWPRYIRDHLQVMLKILEKANQIAADKALAFCLENEVLHGNEFEQTICVFMDEYEEKSKPIKDIKLLNKDIAKNIDHVPDTSNIENYEDIINQKSKNHDKNRNS